MSDHFDSSDDDLEELMEVTEIPKTNKYFEETVPQLNDAQFKEHFRLSRMKTQQLATRFESSQYFSYQEGDSEKISALKYITVFLWYAANEASSFRDVADPFDISKSSLFKIIRRLSHFLSNLSPEIITWPTDAQKDETEAFFRAKGFPGIIRVLDGTHIKIDRPGDDPDSYLNRKKYFSIQAQLVSDHQRKIIDIFVGYPGSVHDSRLLRTSPLYHTLPQKCGIFFFIGDSGYPCLKHLLTPFKDTGYLTRRQRNYNFLLSKTRYIIEHCNGLLKQRLRQLYHPKLKIIPEIVHFIRACAVLYNMCLLEDIPEDEDNDVAQGQNRLIPADQNNLDEDDREGVLKRIEVMNNLQLQI